MKTITVVNVDHHVYDFTAELVMMYDRLLAILGIPPRPWNFFTVRVSS